MAGLIRNLTEIGWGRTGGFGVGARPEQDERWEQIGLAVSVLGPGDKLSLYHREDGQEDFLVLAGAGTIRIEGVERPLRQWDFVHCPPGTAHAIHGGPLTVLAVGVRPVRGLFFPDEGTSDPRVAYAGVGDVERIEYGGWLA